jgi:acyl-CoA synthetase (AMP-forming)/AMP-acid ligase II
MIKVRGFQVAPAELEGHLLKHPDVDDCCVIGVPDDYSGEVPMAFIVLSVSASRRAESGPQAISELKTDISKVHHLLYLIQISEFLTPMADSGWQIIKSNTNDWPEELNLYRRFPRIQVESYCGVCCEIRLKQNARCRMGRRLSSSR